MTKIKNIKIGADPEIFLIDIKTEQPISSIGIIGGTKHEPIDIGQGCALQEDNVMAEFCIPPATSAEELNNSITYALEFIDKKVKPLGYQISIVPSLKFKFEDLDNLQAQTFGCDPDYSAWTKSINIAPTPSPELLLRCAGGHIHVGYDDHDIEKNIKLIKAMDLFLGVPSIVLDTDTDRRSMYGKAGCFRIKPYGVEYRTLSNFWIASEELTNWVFEQTLKAIDFVNNDFDFDDELSMKVQNCINNQNIELANEIIQDLKINVNVQCVV